MLVYTVKEGRHIVINGVIKVHVLRDNDTKLKIGVEAPRNVVVDRDVVHRERMRKAQDSAAKTEGFQAPQA